MRARGREVREPGDGDRGEQGERARDVRGHHAADRALRISAVIAGTTSARSPMTA
jgi:hypothetical protein